jgi:aconitate decarboxylase
MGAVAVASHMMGLDAGRMAHAFGIVGSRTGTLFSNAGTMTKSAHCGQAAAMGLESTLLAEAGFTGDAETFESPLGYSNTYYTGTFKPDEMLHYGRAPWRIVSPGYAIKMFPSQFGTHFVITAGLGLRDQVVDAESIRSVTLTAPVMAYVNRPQPETGLSGKFSLQYTLAAALLDGKVGIHSFTDQRLQAADMQALLPKITVDMDKSISARFETMHVRLRIEMTDGRMLETRCDGPRGMWGQPPIDPAAHLVKVRDCLATRLAPDVAERCIAMASRIDELDAAEVAELMGLVA